MSSEVDFPTSEEVNKTITELGCTVQLPPSECSVEMYHNISQESCIIQLQGNENVIRTKEATMNRL